jgi:hypothetical protein
MSHAISDGRVKSLQGRSTANTTSTTFESFADHLAAAYQAM